METRICLFLLAALNVLSICVCSTLYPIQQEKFEKVGQQTKIHWYLQMSENQILKSIKIKHENETILKWLPHSKHIVKVNDSYLVVSRNMITLMVTSLQTRHYGKYQIDIRLRSKKGSRYFYTSLRSYLNLRTEAEDVLQQQSTRKIDVNTSIANYVITAVLVVAMVAMIVIATMYLNHRRKEIITELKELKISAP